jgi:hypothetical protein
VRRRDGFGGWRDRLGGAGDRRRGRALERAMPDPFEPQITEREARQLDEQPSD